MKFHYLLSTTALLATLTLSQAVYADPAPAAAPAATPSATAGQQPVYSNPRDAILAELPADKAKLYRDTMAQLRLKNGPLRDKIEKLQQDISAVMTTDKFDVAAYLAKSAEIGKTFDQMRANTAEAVVSIATQFTTDQRKILEKMHQQGNPKNQNRGQVPAGQMPPK